MVGDSSASTLSDWFIFIDPSSFLEMCEPLEVVGDGYGTHLGLDLYVWEAVSSSRRNDSVPAAMLSVVAELTTVVFCLSQS